MPRSSENGAARREIGRRLAGALERAGLGHNALARRLGYVPSAVNGWTKGRTQPTLETLGEIAKLTGVSADWLLGLSEARDASAPADVEIQKQQFKALPVVARAAAGPPRLEETTDRRLYAFHESFLKQLKAHELGVVKVHGESMEPTVRNGALVVVDRTPITRPEAIHDGKLYVIQPPGDEGLTVKRVYRSQAPDQIVLWADNERFKPRTQTVSLREQRLQHVLLGRVLWVGQRED